MASIMTFMNINNNYYERTLKTVSKDPNLESN